MLKGFNLHLLHTSFSSPASLVPRLLFTERARKMQSGNETNLLHTHFFGGPALLAHYCHYCVLLILYALILLIYVNLKQLSMLQTALLSQNIKVLTLQMLLVSEEAWPLRSKLTNNVIPTKGWSLP